MCQALFSSRPFVRPACPSALSVPCVSPEARQVAGLPQPSSPAFVPVVPRPRLTAMPPNQVPPRYMPPSVPKPKTPAARPMPAPASVPPAKRHKVHDTPPPTTRSTPTQAPPPQPAAPTAAAPQHTMVPPWMRYTPKTPFSQPTRDHHGTHQGDTAEYPPTVRPRHPLPAGSLPRAHPTPEQIAPPPPWKRYTPATHRHSPPAGTAPGPQHAQEAATHRPADPANAIARAWPIDVTMQQQQQAVKNTCGMVMPLCELVACDHECCVREGSSSLNRSLQSFTR